MTYLLAICGRYQRVGRRFKSKILDEFCEVCGYSRKYAIGLLNRTPGQRRRRAGPRWHYDAAVLEPLKFIWRQAEQMCSKRLKAALPMWLPFYEQRQGPLSEAVRTKLLRISPATIDRLLKKTRARYPARGLSGTRCGRQLKCACAGGDKRPPPERIGTGPPFLAATATAGYGLAG